MKILSACLAGCAIFLAACSTSENQSAETVSSEQPATVTTSLQTIPDVTDTEQPGVVENFVNELVEAGYDNEAFIGILGEQADIKNLPSNILDDVEEVLQYSATESDICSDETFLSDIEITESDRACLREWAELCSRTENLMSSLQETKEMSPNFVSFFEKWNRIACYGNIMVEYVDFLDDFNSRCFEVAAAGELNENCGTAMFDRLCEKTGHVLNETRLIQKDGLTEIPDGDIESLEFTEATLCALAEEVENL